MNTQIDKATAGFVLVVCLVVGLGSASSSAMYDGLA